MKLFQYYDEEQQVHVGAVVKGAYAALPGAVTMGALLGKSSGELEKTVASMTCVPMDPESIRFAPVVTGPEKIICIGLNYHEHINETGLGKTDKPGFPPVFCKFGNALLGHKEELHLPKKAKQFDYEAELVIVMGDTCKEVTPEAAYRYIAGFAAGNDFSARDMQFASSQWTLGKACDGFAPVGPFFVPRDEVNPEKLDISCKVNGEYVQKSNTSKMIFSCGEIVSYLSDFICLKKGDLIFTGTPSGVILGKKKSQQVWLKAGDVVTVEIEGLGTLENRLV